MIDNFSFYDIKNNYLSFLSSSSFFFFFFFFFDSIRRITTFPERHSVFFVVASLTKLSISTSLLTSRVSFSAHEQDRTFQHC